MNLVKAQALAKDLPIPELQKYANGLNPQMIPPWLATGELQSKMDLQKRMQMMQGAAQGEQPSIKEQIEQKAGLMAAQAMQQQQMQQQQAQQMAQGPGPIPAGIPQPEAQPQPPEQAPVMMAARGGLAQLPVNFNFSRGGIIAFSGEERSDVPRIIKVDPKLEDWEVEQIRLENPDAIVQTGQEGSAYGKIGEAIMRNDDVEAMKQRALPRQPSAMDKERERNMQIVQNQGQNPRPVMQNDPRLIGQTPLAETAGAGLMEAAKSKAAPNPAAAPRMAAPQRSPYFAQADAALQKEPEKPTPQQIIAEQNALSPQAMLEESIKKRAEDQRGRADQERANYEANKPDWLDNIIRIHGQAAQYKGMSGLGPAYTAMKQQQRSEDSKMEARLNDLYTSSENKEAEVSSKLFDSRTRAFDSANTSYQNRLKSRSETLAQLANVDQRRMDAVLDRLNAMEVAKMRIIEGTTAGERVTANFLKLKSEGKITEANDLMEAHLRITRGGDKEDTMAKEIAKREVEIAGGLFPEEQKAQMMAGLEVLKRQYSQGSGANSGKNTGTPLPPNASKDNLKVGTVYQTAKGPAKWTGTGFMPI